MKINWIYLFNQIYNLFKRIDKKNLTIAILSIILICFMYQHHSTAIENAYNKGCLDTYKHFEKKQDDERKQVIGIMHKNKCHDYAVFDAITTYSLDPVAYAVMISIESGFYKFAVSSCGAIGYGQIMPYHFTGNVDRYDPYINIKTGSKVFNEAYKAFKGDICKTIVAYNAGFKSAVRYGDKPPFEETINYLRLFERKRNEYGLANA